VSIYQFCNVLYQNRSPQAGKRENWQFVDLSRLQFSRLETCIVYCCIWTVALAKSIVPRKTWRKLWHSYISKPAVIHVCCKLFFFLYYLYVILIFFVFILKADEWWIIHIASSVMLQNAENVMNKLAGNRHKQNSRFCKEIREDNFRFWWRRVHKDALQGMYMSKIEICFFTARILQNHWKFNLHLCQEQLRNVRVSQFSSCFSWDDLFCESHTSYTTIN
jgi:hypothetical protein